MRKSVASLALLVVAAVIGVGTATAAPAGSSSQSREGAKCVKAGVKFLTKNGLLGPAIAQQVDYDTIDTDAGMPANSGLINADLPTPAYLPLSTVISLHYTNPELFDWCAKRGGDEDDD
jgi:hypothetical protein